jgi:hypothetical protein
MPSSTYTPLANITLSTTTAGVTFSSISQAYRDLRLVFMGTTTSLANVLFQFNGDGTSTYSKIEMCARSASSTPLSQTNTTGSGHINWGNATSSSILSSGTVDIMDYSATDKHKPYLARSASQEGDGTYSGTGFIAGRWANTSAITTLYVLPGAGSFAAGTTLTLYGIAS